MINTLIFLFVLGVLILVHEFGHFIVAKKLGVRVDIFSLGFGPKIFKKKIKETEYQLCLIPLGGFVKLAGDSVAEHKGKPDEYLSKTAWQRIQIVFFGPVLNYVLGFLCFWLIFFAGYPSVTSKVGGVIDGYGAKEAGIAAGDEIVSIDGTKVKLWEDLQILVQEKKEKDIVRLGVLRGQTSYTFNTVIKAKELLDVFGKKYSVGLLGITPSEELITMRHGFFESLGLSLRKTIDWTCLTYEALWRMLTGKLSLRDSVTGPLGLFLVTSKAVNAGITALLHLVAILNINLAVFNLLPFPILDGGNILFIIIEKIRKKQISLRVENLINRIGLTMILTLVVVVTYNDIMRFFGEKIVKLIK